MFLDWNKKTYGRHVYCLPENSCFIALSLYKSMWDLVRKKTGNISMSLKITSPWYSCHNVFGIWFFLWYCLQIYFLNTNMFIAQHFAVGIIIVFKYYVICLRAFTLLKRLKIPKRQSEAANRRRTDLHSWFAIMQF